jgi:hypothetical protein
MKTLLAILLFIASLILVGCGGGGGGGGGSANGGQVNLFATDDLSTNYDAVWVKIKKVELRKSDDSFSTAFDDANGRVVNLRALNDAGTQRYSFLGLDSVPQGIYTGVRITLDRTVTLFPTGASTGETRTFDDSYGTGNTVLNVLFANTTIGAGQNDLVLDFDLSQWEINGSGKIGNAVVVKGIGNGLNDPSRHENEDYKGTVSGLSGTSPNFTFTVTTFSGNTLLVETNASTSIFNNNGSPNPTLANGKRVEVRGSFNPTTQRLTATSVKIKNDGGNFDEFEAKGRPSDIDAPGRNFKVIVRRARGFLPDTTFINVVVTDNTRFFTDRGVLITEGQYFAAMAAGGMNMEVEVEGTAFNSNTNTLTATKCKLDDDDNNSNDDAEARGTPSNIDGVAGTFTMALTQWEGFSATAGALINVSTTGGTEYKNADGQNVNKATFFALLALATSVKVEGTYSDGAIVAREARINTSNGGGGGGGGNDPHEINGSISNINAAARTFTVTIIEWEGFNGIPGQQIQVTMNANATYRSDEGDTISEATFFANLAASPLVEVEGTVSGSTMTGVKAKLDDD